MLSLFRRIFLYLQNLTKLLLILKIKFYDLKNHLKLEILTSSLDDPKIVNSIT